MKHGIVADVHSNYNALLPVLEILVEKEKADRLIFIGDMIGYGARPNECIAAIRGTGGAAAIAGNHEWALLGRADMADYNPVARKAIEWTAKHITAENKAWLESLGREYNGNGFTAVHASPRDPINEYVYGEVVFSENLPSMKERLCFIGHTHVSEYYCAEAAAGGKTLRKRLIGGDLLAIEPGMTFMVNCGSAGQPRGGADTRASFCLYDDEAKTVRVFSAEYDIASTQREILEAGLPPFLAFRLERGI